jgi:hypothetical protein
VHLADWGEMYWGHQSISGALIEAHSAKASRPGPGCSWLRSRSHHAVHGIDQLIGKTMAIYIGTPSWHVSGIQIRMGTLSTDRLVIGPCLTPPAAIATPGASSAAARLVPATPRPIAIDSPQLILAWSKRCRGPAARPGTPLDQVRVGCATRTPSKPARASDQVFNIGSLPRCQDLNL